MPVAICKNKEDLNIVVAGRLWPLGYGTNPVRLHLDTFQHLNEPNKTDLLHLKFAF
jgi:hypothetical protein